MRTASPTASALPEGPHAVTACPSLVPDGPARAVSRLVEFSLILAPLLFILLGIIQFGFIFNTVRDAVHGGPRGGSGRLGLRLRPRRLEAGQRHRAEQQDQDHPARVDEQPRRRPSPQFATGTTWTNSTSGTTTTFTNGDLVIIYELPSGVTDNDMRTGYRMTARATYHQDLLLPLIGNLLPRDGQRAPDPGRRGHDGHQLMARRPVRPGVRRSRVRERGQVLVIFVLSLTAIFAAAGLAIDIGRLYMERRFLENAADAAALAAANSLIRGNTDANARSDAMAVLTKNFTSPPNGITPSLPPAAGSEVYESGHAGDPMYLVDGILINGSDIRVAVRNTIGYTFGRAVGMTSRQMVGRARVGANGDALPIAVRHFINRRARRRARRRRAMATRTTSRTSSRPRTPPASEPRPTPRCAPRPRPALPFDSVQPEQRSGAPRADHRLVGQGAQASNTSSFRGFIALDIRNYQSATSNVYYNGVTAGTNANTLKAIEAGLGRDRLSRARVPAGHLAARSRTTRSRSSTATRRASSSTRSRTDSCPARRSSRRSTPAPS